MDYSVAEADNLVVSHQSDGKVVIYRADKIDRDSDPIIGEFLNFLAQDIKQNPHHVTAISADLLNCVQSLVSEVDLDLDAALVVGD